MQVFLDRAQCFLLVVDIQERLHAAMEETFRDTYVKNGIILVETARAFSLPIVVSEQYPRGLGATIEPVAARLGDIPRREKLSFSCFRDEAIHAEMETLGRKTAVIAGIEAHVCVMQTALDLLGAGYTVAVASDAVCSRRTRDRQAALDAMARLSVLVYPTETIAFMLMERAGTPEFRQLSPLFR
ncbi:MAG TPA: isochorismatase family protein [Deltaproteobacteria bacterium]|nr:isochorismatase family protein [Deltaproteobacteria bacterium]HQI81713.1 isochorismatase family protein [Deltaproteobacteria bacterium]